jgi:hypothetical protein
VVISGGTVAGDLVTTESFYVSGVVNGIPGTVGAVGTTYLADPGVTQAKLGAGVAGNGPAFSAYKSTNQTVSNNTITKITFDTEEFDTRNNFAAGAFTPDVAGYYILTAAVAWGAGTGTAHMRFYKNGAGAKDGSSDYIDSIANTTNAAALIYLNGSTDYAEVYGYQSSGGSLAAVGGTGNYTYFQGVLVRAA